MSWVWVIGIGGYGALALVLAMWSATGISPASYGRLLKVSRILREDPRAVILPEEKVSAEHVSMMRELVGR